MNAQDRLAVPIPRLLLTRQRDKRGYPIPFIALIDRAGEPQFTINDMHRLQACRSKRLCGLCGKRFDHLGMWFIGGPRCFTHPYGAFVDPPSHHACAEYALRVCPYLAAPSYAKRIDLGKMTDESYGDAMAIVMHNDMPDERPACFGLGATHAYEYLENPGVFVIDRWEYVEWWRDGMVTGAPSLND